MVRGQLRKPVVGGEKGKLKFRRAKGQGGI